MTTLLFLQPIIIYFRDSVEIKSGLRICLLIHYIDTSRSFATVYFFNIFIIGWITFTFAVITQVLLECVVRTYCLCNDVIIFFKFGSIFICHLCIYYTRCYENCNMCDMNHNMYLCVCYVDFCLRNVIKISVLLGGLLILIIVGFKNHS